LECGGSPGLSLEGPPLSSIVSLKRSPPSLQLKLLACRTFLRQ